MPYARSLRPACTSRGGAPSIPTARYPAACEIRCPISVRSTVRRWTAAQSTCETHFEEIIGGTLGKVVVALFASSIHLSGHPSAEELRLLRALVRPRRFVPIHGEYRQLAFHGRLAATLSGATHRC